MGSCRLCLSPEASCRIFQRGARLAQRIRLCCRLRISKKDGLTDWICIHCIMMLEKLTSFINICKESDNVLRSNKNCELDKEVKVERDVINMADLEPVCDLKFGPNLQCLNVDPDVVTIKDEVKSNHSDETSDNVLNFNENEYTNNFLENNIVKVESSSTIIHNENPHIFNENEYTDNFLVNNIVKDESSAIIPNEKPHPCPLCSKEFVSHRGLSVHMKHHNSKVEFGCVRCGGQFVSKEQQKEHEIAHCIPYSCETCGKTYATKSQMNAHIRDVHLQSQRMQCDVCEKYLNSHSSYKRHMRSHSDQPKYECDICSKVYPNRICMIRHVRRHSKNKIKEKGKLCPICGKVLKPKSFYNHMQVHSGEKKFTCNKCRKCFVSNSKLKEHEVIHANDQTFNCSQCDKVFTCLRNCKNHEKYVHLKLRRVQCKICGKFLCSKTSYENHIKTHTGQWDYQCDVCKKNFIHKSNMISHLRMHFGDRPYACQYCPSKFTNAKTLVEHERLHTGEKPYKCPVCEKGFAQKGNMKSHIRYNHKNTDPV